MAPPRCTAWVPGFLGSCPPWSPRLARPALFTMDPAACHPTRRVTSGHVSMQKHVKFWHVQKSECQSCVNVGPHVSLWWLILTKNQSRSELEMPACANMWKQTCCHPLHGLLAIGRRCVKTRRSLFNNGSVSICGAWSICFTGKPRNVCWCVGATKMRAQNNHFPLVKSSNFWSPKRLPCNGRRGLGFLKHGFCPLTRRPQHSKRIFCSYSSWLEKSLGAFLVCLLSEHELLAGPCNFSPAKLRKGGPSSCASCCYNPMLQVCITSRHCQNSAGLCGSSKCFSQMWNL